MCSAKKKKQKNRGVQERIGSYSNDEIPSDRQRIYVPIFQPMNHTHEVYWDFSGDIFYLFLHCESGNIM